MAVAPKSEPIEVAAEVNRLLPEGRHGLRILVTGRTGVGKSSLINSIVGKYVAVEGDSPCLETKELTKYEKNVGDIMVTIYDSPGLQDGITDKHAEKEYLKKLEQICRDVDLNLYCVKMNDRMDAREEAAIKKLSIACGMDRFWQNTVIVLTFANDIKPPRSAHYSSGAHFSKRISEWKFILRRVLIDKAGVSKKVVENIPIVPAGYSDKPSLPAANCDYWLSDLWFQCLGRTRDIGEPILLKLNRDRLRPTEEEMDIRRKKGYEQPIMPPGEMAPSGFEAYLKKFWKAIGLGD